MQYFVIFGSRLFENILAIITCANTFVSSEQFMLVDKGFLRCFQIDKKKIHVKIHANVFFNMDFHDDVIKWNHFRVTGPLCGEFTGYWWISLTRASDAELGCFLWYAPQQQ